MRAPAHTSLFASNIVGAIALLLVLSQDGSPVRLATDTSVAVRTEARVDAHTVNRSSKGDRLPVAGASSRPSPWPAQTPPASKPKAKKAPVGCEPPFSSIISLPAGSYTGRCITDLGAAGKTAVG